MMNKRYIFFCFLIMLPVLFLFTTPTSANMMFRINEIRGNQQLQGAEVGFGLENFIITGGLDGASVNFSAATTDHQLNPNTGERTEVVTTLTAGGSLYFFNAGLMLFFSETIEPDIEEEEKKKPTNGVRPYIRGSVFRSLSSINYDIEVRENGEQQDLEGEDDEYEELIELIKDSLKVTGLKIGFGAEYRFNEHIGLSGETGFRYFWNSIRTEEEEWGNIVRTIETSASVGLGFTYTSLGLSFYF